MKITKAEITDLGFSLECEYRSFFEYHKTSSIFIQVYKQKVNNEWLALFCHNESKVKIKDISHLRSMLYEIEKAT